MLGENAGAPAVGREREAPPPPPRDPSFRIPYEYFVVDAAAAATAAVFVTPIVSAVDRAVAEAATGQTTLWASFAQSLQKMVRNPRAMFLSPEFRLVWCLYAGTYSVNNVCCTFEDFTTKNSKEPQAKTATIFCANTTLSMWKDTAFVRLFGKAAAAAVPGRAYAAWAVRDVFGMWAIFTLPSIVAPEVAETLHVSPSAGDTISQFVLPLLIQPFVAPFHLLGYLVSNNPAAPVSSHLPQLRAQFTSVTVIRWIRGFPPYCIGASVNKTGRRELQSILRHPPTELLVPPTT